MAEKNLVELWDQIKNGYHHLVQNPSLVEDVFHDSNLLKISSDIGYVHAKSNLSQSYWRENLQQLNKAFQSTTGLSIELRVVNDPQEIPQDIPNHSQNQQQYLDRRFTLNDYVVGDSNINSYHLLNDYLNTNEIKFNPIFLYGSVGIGKTHLVSGFANDYLKRYQNASLQYIDAMNFTREIVDISSKNSRDFEQLKQRYFQYDVLIIDDIQHLSDKNKTNEILFQIINYMIKENKLMIMTSDTAPDKLVGFEDRMISRFSSGITNQIRIPDEKILRTIITKKLSNHNLALSQEAMQLMINSFFDDIRKLIGSLNKLIFFHPNTQSNGVVVIDEKAVMSVLELEHITHQPHQKMTLLNPMVIITAVAKLYGVSANELIGHSRSSKHTQPRHIAMYILKTKYQLPSTEIGRILGNRDHTTVLNGINKVKETLKTNPELNQTIHDLLKKIS